MYPKRPLFGAFIQILREKKFLKIVFCEPEKLKPETEKRRKKKKSRF